VTWSEELLHRRGVRGPAVDRLCVPWDVRDHVGVVDRVHRGEVPGVEGVVALLHERRQVSGPVGKVSHVGILEVNYNFSIDYNILGSGLFQLRIGPSAC
jgi:hypothetical protein